ERVLREALALDPKGLLPNRALVVLLLGAGRKAEAEPYLKTIVEVSGQPAAKLMLADFYISVDRRSDARQLLAELVKDPGSFSTATVRLASLALAEGDAAGAHKLVDQVLAKNPLDTDALVAKTDLLLRDHRIDEALVTAQRVTKADPREARGQYMLGA